MAATHVEADGDKLIIRHIQDDIPIVQQNYVERMAANNGYSQSRLFRKVASIPAVAVIEAERQGYDMSDRRDVKLFLERNPQYKTVSKL